jgi:integrase
MASIIKVGPLQYQAQIRKKGWPSVYKTFEKRQQALDFAAQIESEMIRGTYVNRTEADSTTLKEALTRYVKDVSPQKKGYDVEKIRINALMRHKLALRSLSSIRSSDIAEYRDERLGESKSASTVINELAIISHLFTTALKDWGIPVINPVLGIRKPKANNSRSRRLVKDEEQRIINAIRSASEFANDRTNIWIEPIFLFAIETAMRKSEILKLTWNNVHLSQGYISLNNTKNGESRDVPLSNKASNILEGLPKVVLKKVVQIDAIKKSKSDVDNPNKVFKTTSEALGQSWKRVVLRARKAYEKELLAAGVNEIEIANNKLLKDLNFHDLRHEATTRLASIFEMHELMKITGHKDARMVARYYHPKASDLAKKLRNGS